MKRYQEIADYVYLNSPQCRQWKVEQFNRFMRFHYNGGLTCLVLDVDDSIAGAALIRPVMMEHSPDLNAYDPEGDCLFLSQVISTKKGALQSLGMAVLKQFGMRPWVAWHKGDKLVIHRSSVLRRNLFREALHGQFKS